MNSFLIASRALHYASTISLAGVFVFVCFVATREVSPRLGRRLSLLAWTSLALAVLSGTAWLLFVAAQMSGQPISVMVSQGVVGIVLQRTRFGQVWTARTALAFISAALLVLARGWRSRLRCWSGLAVAAGLLASLAWAGHGAATPGRPGDLHLTADIVHLLAAGAWVGALVPLALFLAEFRRNRQPLVPNAQRAVKRFSILAAISVTVLFVAGLVNTWFLAGSVPALIGTEYGRLVLAKLAIFVTMVTFGAVNLLRMSPRLAPITSAGRAIAAAAVDHLRRNALIEAGLGVVVLCIVAVLGTLAPGLHTEPGWPLPFRFDLAVLASPAKTALAVLALAALGFAVAGVAATAAGYYRAAGAGTGALVLCLAGGWLFLRPGIEPAYPTTFYAPAEAYAADSIERGARLYSENCALCHGAGGKGDGPAAATLPNRPADLTAPHLFAHTDGDLFWWVSNGKANGAMPGFSGVLTAAARWDVINFVRARAAGILCRGIGPEVSTAAAPAIPDFAFELDGHQQTLGNLLQAGPTLISLFDAAPPPSRLAQLERAQSRFAAAGLRFVAVDLGPNRVTQAETPLSAPLAMVSRDVARTLALFLAPADGGETDLLLDRAGRVRARW
ncbi:MAG: copper homeostasis membrane protein CopD, partial [Alphaproteobacteria bacterium]|nr:copper homeostasis membrane protein CopD [Alphaproteobacteria bacterium]